MIDGSYFEMLNKYRSKDFGKHFTIALILGLKNSIGGGEIAEEIEYSLKNYKEEDKQLFEVATHIRDYIRMELEKAKVPIDEMMKSEISKSDWKSLYGLSNFLSQIMYEYIDYHEVAKELTKFYKQTKKFQIKKVA